jgi:hypothetical protein
MNHRQYVHVARYISIVSLQEIEDGIIGVYNTRNDGIKAALQDAAEHIEYDWEGNFSRGFIGALRDFISAGEFDNALQLWNDNNSEYKLFVSVEELDDDPFELDIELPS